MAGVKDQLYKWNTYDHDQLDILRDQFKIFTPKHFDDVILAGTPKAPTSADSQNDYVQLSVEDYNNKHDKKYKNISEVAVDDPTAAAKIIANKYSIFSERTAVTGVGGDRTASDLRVALGQINDDMRTMFNTKVTIDFSQFNGVDANTMSAAQQQQALNGNGLALGRDNTFIWTGGGSTPAVQVPGYTYDWDTLEGYKSIFDMDGPKEGEGNGEANWRILNGTLAEVNAGYRDDNLPEIGEGELTRRKAAQDRWKNLTDRGKILPIMVAKMFKAGQVKPARPQVERLESATRSQFGALRSPTEDGTFLAFARDAAARALVDAEGNAQEATEWSKQDGYDLFRRLLNNNDLLGKALGDYFTRQGIPIPDGLSLNGVRKFLTAMDATERARYLGVGGKYEIGDTYLGGAFPIYSGDPAWSAR